MLWFRLRAAHYFDHVTKYRMWLCVSWKTRMTSLIVARIWRTSSQQLVNLQKIYMHAFAVCVGVCKPQKSFFFSLSHYSLLRKEKGCFQDKNATLLKNIIQWAQVSMWDNQSLQINRTKILRMDKPPVTFYSSFAINNFTKSF